MGLLRRTLVFAILILSLIGIPLPAHAASGEESPPSRSMGRPPVGAAPRPSHRCSLSLPALLQQGDARSAVWWWTPPGSPLPTSASNSAGRAVKDHCGWWRTTDTNGQFVYGGLGPGRYEIELRDETRVLATSGPIELSEEAMRVSGVTVARPAPPQRRRRYGSADQLLGDNRSWSPSTRCSRSSTLDTRSS